ncbi:hypothetical protein HDU87_000016 [Geranomyces variabilis]|uniref:RRM domain-containing protein n=1 Tax=Geranomyces variabilis TaxID=109894 RepID=A0AAD5XU09_9FUNG|nr:hypothetical protein HDU87_000016 [Geranomyces variabilis]
MRSPEKRKRKPGPSPLKGYSPKKRRALVAGIKPVVWNVVTRGDGGVSQEEDTGGETVGVPSSPLPAPSSAYVPMSVSPGPSSDSAVSEHENKESLVGAVGEVLAPVEMSHGEQLETMKEALHVNQKDADDVTRRQGDEVVPCAPELSEIDVEAGLQQRQQPPPGARNSPSVEKDNVEQKNEKCVLSQQAVPLKVDEGRGSERTEESCDEKMKWPDSRQRPSREATPAQPGSPKTVQSLDAASASGFTEPCEREKSSTQSILAQLAAPSDMAVTERQEWPTLQPASKESAPAFPHVRPEFCQGPRQATTPVQSRLPEPGPSATAVKPSANCRPQPRDSIKTPPQKSGLPIRAPTPSPRKPPTPASRPVRNKTVPSRSAPERRPETQTARKPGTTTSAPARKPDRSLGRKPATCDSEPTFKTGEPHLPAARMADDLSRAASPRAALPPKGKVKIQAFHPYELNERPASRPTPQPQALCSQYIGPVVAVKLKNDNEGTRARVIFVNEESIEKAIEEFDGVVLKVTLFPLPNPRELAAAHAQTATEIAIGAPEGPALDPARAAALGKWKKFTENKVEVHPAVANDKIGDGLLHRSGDNFRPQSRFSSQWPCDKTDIWFPSHSSSYKRYRDTKKTPWRDLHDSAGSSHQPSRSSDGGRGERRDHRDEKIGNHDDTASGRGDEHRNKRARKDDDCRHKPHGRKTPREGLREINHRILKKQIERAKPRKHRHGHSHKPAVNSNSQDRSGDCLASGNCVQDSTNAAASANDVMGGHSDGPHDGASAANEVVGGVHLGANSDAPHDEASATNDVAGAQLHAPMDEESAPISSSSPDIPAGCESRSNETTGQGCSGMGARDVRRTLAGLSKQAGSKRGEAKQGGISSQILLTTHPSMPATARDQRMGSSRAAVVENSSTALAVSARYCGLAESGRQNLLQPVTERKHAGAPNKKAKDNHTAPQCDSAASGRESKHHVADVSDGGGAQAKGVGESSCQAC